MYKIVLNITLIVAIASLFAEGQELDCERKLANVDRCVRRLLKFENVTVVIPRTEDQLKNGYCKDIKRTLSCIRSYSPCLKRFPRSILNMAMSRIKQILKSVCDTSDGRKEVLNHIKCLKSSDVKYLLQFIDLVTEMVEYLYDNVGKSSNLIGSACCTYHLFTGHGHKVLTDVCPSNPKLADYFIGLVKQAVNDILELGCGGNKFGNTKQCESSMAALSKVFNEKIVEINTGKVPPKRISPAIPLIALANKLDEELE